MHHEDEADGTVLPEDDASDEGDDGVGHMSTGGADLPQEQADYLANSTPVDRPRRPHNLSSFKLAIGLFCYEYNVSRSQYTALRETLNLLKQNGGLAQLNQLPLTVDTLKRHVHEERPHIEIRQKEVSLQPEKLSSSRRQNAIVAGRDLSQQLYYFNPVDMIGRVLSSSLTAKMHFGLADLVDTPAEAWHSSQWAGSIRTTSGEFARYPNNDPIFPGDLIRFTCSLRSCPLCRADHSTPDAKHLGQVMEVYRDQRDSTRGSEPGPREGLPMQL